MSDGGWFHGGPGYDYADKHSLRRPRLREWLLDSARALMILALMLFVLVSILQAIEAHAAGIFAVLLEPSAQSATMHECDAVRPGAFMTISRQERSNEPWHHRICLYLETK